MRNKKYGLLNILAWIAFFVVILYLFLKIIGVIHSPATIDLVALLSGAYFIGRYVQKINLFFRDVEHIKNDLKVLDKKCPLFKKEE